MNKFKNLITSQSFRYLSQFVKKLNNSSYFNIFNLKNEFAINEEQLAKTFKSMQMIYHPDKTAKLDQDSREIADFNSSLINHAYQTLKDPYKRGLHLLNLNNLSIEEDESTDNLSNDFLHEMMDLNEQITEKRNATDELKKMLDEIDKEQERILRLIKQNFDNKNYENAKRHLIKFNFYNNIREKIIDFMD